jgi:hypothetical protein
VWTGKIIPALIRDGIRGNRFVAGFSLNTQRLSNRLSHLSAVMAGVLSVATFFSKTIRNLFPLRLERGEE